MRLGGSIERTSSRTALGGHRQSVQQGVYQPTIYPKELLPVYHSCIHKFHRDRPLLDETLVNLISGTGRPNF